MRWSRSLSRLSALASLVGDLDGPAAGAAVLLVAVVLVGPSRPGAWLATLALLILGLPLVALVLRAMGPPGGPAAPGPGALPWRRAALSGALTGLLPVVAWTAVGGPGWGARAAVLAATGAWVASAALAASSNRRAFNQAPAVGLASLLLLALLGYTTGAGIVYYLGLPSALCTLLAGHYLASAGQGPDAGRSVYVTISYALAAVAVTLFAWVDLG